MLQDVFWAIEIKFYTALFTQELMVYVLINLKTWNAVTIGDPVLWVSMALIQSRIILYSHTFILCVKTYGWNVTNEVAVFKGILFTYLFIFWESHLVASTGLKFAM